MEEKEAVRTSKNMYHVNHIQELRLVSSKYELYYNKIIAVVTKISFHGK